MQLDCSPVAQSVIKKTEDKQINPV
jgi:hypothetical protein